MSDNMRTRFILFPLLIIVALATMAMFFTNGLSRDLEPQQEVQQETQQMPQDERGVQDGQATQDEQVESGDQNTQDEQPLVVSSTATESGQTAFELTQREHDIVYDEYDFGIFITEINGVASTESHFWALYVNGESSLVGATNVVLETGDVVEWRYTAVEM